MITGMLGEYVSYVLELLQYRDVEKQYNNVLIVNECKFELNVCLSILVFDTLLSFALQSIIFEILLI